MEAILDIAKLIRYRLVQVRQNLKKKKKKLGLAARNPLSLSLARSFSSSLYVLSFSKQNQAKKFFSGSIKARIWPDLWKMLLAALSWLCMRFSVNKVWERIVSAVTLRWSLLWNSVSAVRWVLVLKSLSSVRWVWKGECWVGMAERVHVEVWISGKEPLPIFKLCPFSPFYPFWFGHRSLSLDSVVCFLWLSAIGTMSCKELGVGQQTHHDRKLNFMPLISFRSLVHNTHGEAETSGRQRVLVSPPEYSFFSQTPAVSCTFPKHDVSEAILACHPLYPQNDWTRWQNRAEQ